ncbi:hypothetical protein V8C86DRAFT_2646104 [Haematococcus lacustris]
MAGRTLAVIGGVCGISYGAYYGIQSSEISKTQKEVKDLSQLVDRERKAAASTAALISEQESKAAALQRQEEASRAAVAQTEERIERVRAELEGLESEKERQLQLARKCAADSKSVLGRLASLRSQVLKAQEAATLGEKSLVQARQRATEAQKLLNPLNHPSLKSVLGTGKK